MTPIQRIASRALQSSDWGKLSVLPISKSSVPDELEAFLETLSDDSASDKLTYKAYLHALKTGDLQELQRLGAISKETMQKLSDAFEAWENDEHEEAKEMTKKIASQHSLLDAVIPQHAFIQFVHSLDKQDAQAADLARNVYMELHEKTSIADNAYMALNRLRNSVESSSWDPGTQRNNIFKAADLLGMKLPSHMFASQSPMDKQADDTGYIGEKIKNALDNMRREMYDLKERIDTVERAWSKWDLRTLVGEQVISQSDVRTLEHSFQEQTEYVGTSEVDDWLNETEGRALIRAAMKNKSAALVQSQTTKV